MTNRAKKTTALLLTLIMLFTSLPLDVFAGTTASPWYDFVTGKELTEAVTKENYDAKAVKLYVGEEGYYSENLNYCSNYQAVWFSGNMYHASNEGHAILSPFTSDEPGSTLAKDNYLYVQVINPRVEPTIENCKITAMGNQGRDIYVTANANDANTSVSADVITKNGKNDLWQGLSWSSSNSSVVSVNPSGTTVEFVAPGSATLTVTGKITGANNVETTLEGHIYVTVESPKLESIVLNHTDTIDLYVGDTLSLNVTETTPGNYLNRGGRKSDFLWRSNDPAVVEVDGNDTTATLTALSEGSSMIVVSYGDAYHEVLVRVAQPNMLVAPNDLTLVEGQFGTVVTQIRTASPGSTIQPSVISGSDAVTFTWLPKENGTFTDGSLYIYAIEEGDAKIRFKMIDINNGNNVVATQDVTVHVVAAEDTETPVYTVTYQDFDDSVLKAVMAEEGSTLSVEDFNLERVGYVYQDSFTADDPAGTVYSADSSKGATTITVEDNMVLTANYEPKVCDLTFAVDPAFASFGTLPDNQSVAFGGKFAKPVNYGLEEKKIWDSARNQNVYYQFLGWKQLVDGELVKYDFANTIVTDDLTLYADWELVYCNITRVVQDNGNYRPDGENDRVLKGTVNHVVRNLDWFTYGQPLYQYEYVNTNGVGKIVKFCLWQEGNTEIRQDKLNNGAYTIPGEILKDMTFIAVYEPTPFGYIGGFNNMSYWHSTDVYIPVVYVDADTGDEISQETILTDVYPLYGVTTSPVFGLKYDYNVEGEEYREQDYSAQLSGGLHSGDYDYSRVDDTHNAKYGRVNLQYLLGEEYDRTVNNTTKKYTIIEVDDSQVETVWLCVCHGHTFNGYCFGGTWNPLGHVVVKVREENSQYASIEVNNYIVLDDEWQPSDGVEALESTDLVKFNGSTANLNPGTVLNHNDYVEGLGGYYRLVTYKWILGTDRELVQNGGNYVLNMYYRDAKYTYDVEYRYKETDELIPNSNLSTGANKVQGPDLYPNSSFSVVSPTETNGFVPDVQEVKGTIIDHDLHYVVYYAKQVPIHYVVVGKGGIVSSPFEIFTSDSQKAQGSVSIPAVGYEFDGWYSDSECKNEITQTSSADPTKYVPVQPSDGTWKEVTYYTRFKPILTDVKVTKKWVDENNQDGKREPITLKVQKNVNGWTDVSGYSVTLTADDLANNEFSYTFEDLPKFENNHEVSYRVVETVPASFNGVYTESSSTNKGTDGFWKTEITNTHTPEMLTIPVEKKWNGDTESTRPASVTVELFRNDETTAYASVTLTAANNWRGSFSVPKYTAGKENKWTLSEITVPGYDGSMVTGAADATGYTVTNIYPEKPKKTVDKAAAEYGEAITFTVSGKNTTASNAKITLTDALPAGVDFASATGNYTYDSVNRVVTWVFTDVAPMASVNATVTATLNAAALKIDEINNTVTKITNDDPNSKLESTPTETQVKKPQLTVDKQVDKQDVAYDDVVNGNAILTYTLTVKNVGEGKAKTVTVTDTLPADVQVNGTLPTGMSQSGNIITWIIDELAVNESKSIFFSVKIVPNTDEMVFTNAVTATTPGDDNTPPTDEVTTKVGKIIVKKSHTISGKAADAAAKAGDVVTYTLTVTNDGEVELNDVTLDDSMFKTGMSVKVNGGASTTLTGDTLNIGLLDVDESATVSYEYTVTAADVANGKINNTVTATGKTPENDVVTDEDSDKVLVNKDIVVEKVWQDGDGVIAPAADLTIELYNGTAKVDSKDLSMTDATQKVTFENKPVLDAAGNVIAYTVKEKGESNGKITLNGLVYSVTVSAVSADNTATVTNKLDDTDDVPPTKTVNKAEAEFGEELVFTVGAKNTLSSKAKITLTDTLPVGLTFQSATNGGAYDAGTRVVTWTFTDVAPLASVSASLTATVNEDALSKDEINNTVTKITNDDPDSALDSTPTVTKILKPDLKINKTVNKTYLSYNDVQAGTATLIYTLTVKNEGEGKTTAVTVTDTLPADVEVSGDLPNGMTLAGDNKIEWLLGELAAGDEVSESFTVAVKPTEALEFTNGVTATMPGDDTPHTDEVTTYVGKIDVEKSHTIAGKAADAAAKQGTDLIHQPFFQSRPQTGIDAGIPHLTGDKGADVECLRRELLRLHLRLVFGKLVSSSGRLYIQTRAAAYHRDAAA